MEKDFYELTSSQKALWEEELVFKKSPLNNIAAYLVINEDVDFKKLRKAIKTFISSNDNFSIRIEKQSNQAPIQKFVNTSLPEIPVVKLDNVEKVEELVTKMVNTPFSLLGSPLYDFRMFKFPDGTGGFLMNSHHLIMDAWSAGIIIKQVMSIYQNPKEVLPGYSYIDHINDEKAYLKSDKFVKDREYWEEKIKTLPSIVSLPRSVKQSTEEPTSNSKRKDCKLTVNLSQKIWRFCKENKISPYVFFMSVYSLYFAKICSTNNLSIGTPVLGRSNFKDKNTSGVFISTIPFIVNIDWDLSFNEFLRNISTDTISNFRHDRYPQENIIKKAKESDPELSSLFSVFLSYQNVRTTKSDTLDFYSKWMAPNAIFNDLQIHIHDINDTDSLSISYDYKTSKYTENSVVEFHKRILEMCNNLITKPHTDLRDVDVVTLKEKKELLNMFDTKKYYRKNLTIQDLVEDQAKKHPKKIAVIANEKTITYGELNEKANSLAYYLRKQGVKRNTFVGIMQKRSIEMMVSLLAVLKAGGAYLPLDYNYPKDRITYMLENSEAKIVLTDKEICSEVPVMNDVQVLTVSLDDELFKTHKKNLRNINKSDDACYIIYTSGSTGKPKGVKLAHKNIHNFILGMCNKINFSKEKTIVSVTTICFDIFVLESWLPLSKGLTIVLANEEEQNDQRLLNALCREHTVNIIQTTPSRMKKLIQDPAYCEYFKSITDILVGGEGFPQALLTSLKRLSRINNAKIYNVYGPTETAVWSTVKDLTNTTVINIGEPISNTSCYILDNMTNTLLPKGSEGTLFIGGDGVCLGYHKRDDLNEKLFIKNKYKTKEIIYNTNDLAKISSTNEIVHLGRADFQVKIRGYRIEIGEIENKILEYPNISDVTITSQDSNFLICYYVSNKDIIISNLISYLLETLPNYMIPGYFVKLDKMPLTPNGKVDRKSLPKVRLDEENIVKASTKTEKLLEKSILKVLNNTLKTVDINTPFISLGLDSLSIVQLQSMLLENKLNLTTQTFYKFPTVKSLANYIDKHDSLNTEIAFTLPPALLHNSDEVIQNPKANDLGNVFLTGATGFIGSHILNEILETTSSKVYCLVRGTSKQYAKDRLVSTYKFYFNKDLCKSYKGRVIIVNGDITLPKLGLSEEESNLVKTSANTVIHSAAIVKHYGNYNEFKKINISGTKEIADFAYKNKLRFIHISSISVSGNYLLKDLKKDTDFSENNLYIGQHYTENVYVNSKLESENVVYKFMKKGLRGKVLRIGILSGREKDGLFQKNIYANAFYGRIKSFISIGAIPKELLPQKIEFTPIDECTRAILILAKTKEYDNKIFHLYNHNLVTLKYVVDVIKKAGYDIKVLSEENFKDTIIKYSKEKNENVSALVNDFDTSNLSLDYNYTVNIKSDFTQKILKQLGFTWAKIDDKYITKIINYMKDVDFI